MTKGHHEGANKEDEVGFIDPNANKKTCCQKMCGSLRGLGHFMYNPKTHLVMGRSGKEWLQLLAFYLVFYVCLVGFWIACLVGFLSTTNLQKPTLLGYQSMLQLNPAIGYRPQPDFETNLIKFDSSNPQSYVKFVNNSLKYLEPYFDTQGNLTDCSGGVKANETIGCKFNPQTVAPACFPESSPPYNLGFDKAAPCIVLKMNRIIGWMPSNVPNTTNTYNDVKVRCVGENAADNETIGEVKYYPGGSDERGPYGLISAKYFPYMKQVGYLSPLVFAHFKNIKKYTLALIWCQFDVDAMDFVPGTYWASQALTERAGGAHFELVVDAGAAAPVAPVAVVPVTTSAPAKPATSATAKPAVTTPAASG